ncbi:antisense RNA protein [Gallid alphaherpesvirus 2]|nr:antisense RNA protein [synthetic construct]AYC12207.1 antisense RNA protein [Gallid alphaherpesvirus 2]ACF49694.1 antisense RNA protein [synthetic construct]AYC12242.1 antisense RNA protein [Gallid alphaherpesvirus 2]UOW64724.1 antisense RNA protein [Gallid alphaherpesvirus 2]
MYPIVRLAMVRGHRVFAARRLDKGPPEWLAYVEKSPRLRQKLPTSCRNQAGCPFLGFRRGANRWWVGRCEGNTEGVAVYDSLWGSRGNGPPMLDHKMWGEGSYGSSAEIPMC